MTFGSRPDLARWATTRQLRQAGLFAPEGLILGRTHGRLLRHDGHEPLLMVAATGAGKTTCFVVPNLFTWRQSVVVHDPSFELYGMTAAYRSTMSRVVQLCPTESRSQRHNPLDGVAWGEEGETRDVQLLSDLIADPSGKGDDERRGAERHFIDMARKVCQGLLVYGHYTQRARCLGAMGPLLRAQDFEDLLLAWERYPHPLTQDAAWAIKHAGKQGELGGIITTFTRLLELYADPIIQRATDTSDFSLRDLRERARPMTLYLSIPPRDRGRLRPWTRMVMRQILDYAVEQRFLPEVRATKPVWDLLVMVDEFQALGHLLAVKEMANYGRKFALRLALITPSLEELVGIYGQNHPFLEACKVKVIFGLNSVKVADLFSRSIGPQEVTKTRQTGGQTSREWVKEPLLSSTALMSLDPRKALVLAGQHQVIVNKVHYQERNWL